MINLKQLEFTFSHECFFLVWKFCTKWYEYEVLLGMICLHFQIVFRTINFRIEIKVCIVLNAFSSIIIEQSRIIKCCWGFIVHDVNRDERIHMDTRWNSRCNTILGFCSFGYFICMRGTSTTSEHFEITFCTSAKKFASQWIFFFWRKKQQPAIAFI